jgi:hypothetical protein
VDGRGGCSRAARPEVENRDRHLGD